MFVSSGARVGAANNGTSPEVGAVASIAREGVQVAGWRKKFGPGGFSGRDKL